MDVALDALVLEEGDGGGVCLGEGVGAGEMGGVDVWGGHIREHRYIVGTSIVGTSASNVRNLGRRGGDVEMRMRLTLKIAECIVFTGWKGSE